MTAPVSEHHLLFFQSGVLLDKKTDKVAFRRALVVQDKLIDQEGLTFLFEINNVRIFCGGECTGLSSQTPVQYRF